jgi:hypothetical protein
MQGGGAMADLGQSLASWHREQESQDNRRGLMVALLSKNSGQPTTAQCLGPSGKALFIRAQLGPLFSRAPAAVKELR